MRVIAGRLRGRRLRGPRKTELRPTGDRLKESLFSILDPDLRGASVLDVFAGTGAIGIEAVSRGASEVVFIDSNEGACRLVRRNLDLCGITSGYTLVHDDAFKALRRLGREGRRFDVVFLDPPYDWGPYAELIALVFRLGIAGEGSRVCMEHHRKVVVPAAGIGHRLVRTVRQGDKRLSFFAVAGGPADSPCEA